MITSGPWPPLRQITNFAQKVEKSLRPLAICNDTLDRFPAHEESNQPRYLSTRKLIGRLFACALRPTLSRAKCAFVTTLT